jgi:hypothetical protein
MTNVFHDYSLDKIFLNELGGLLGYSSRNSVKNWCKKNLIEIYSYGNKRYIHKYDYENIIRAKQIEVFKNKYGKDWENAFELARRNELYKLDIQQEPISIHSNTRYVPKSKAASRLLKKNSK